MSTTATTTAPEINVTVVGPNGVQALEVHAAGCADLGQRKYRRSEKTTETARSLHDLVESWYSDMIGEDGESTWEDFTGEFKIFPCVGHLPTDHDAPAPAKRTRKSPTKKAAKSPVQRAQRSKVGEYPATPAKLVWTTEDGARTAQGDRHSYRITDDGAGRYFASQRLTKGGHWVHIAGSTKTRQQAEKLAGWVEAGATWLSYTKLAGVAFEELPKAA